MASNIGYNIDYKPEKLNDEDKKCPHYGKVSIRGKIFEGEVVSDKMLRTVKVQWESMVRDKKFNRYYKKKTSVLAHNSENVNAKVGDKVLIGETRPISKRKHFTVIKIIGGNEK